MKRKKINPQKLAGQVRWALQRLEAHKNHEYEVNSQGELQWQRRNHLIQAELLWDALHWLSINDTFQKTSSSGAVSY